MSRERWEDRAVDAALHELHGSKPPDLSARVLLALDESPASGRLPSLRPGPRLPRAGAAWFAAAALLLASLTVAAWAWSRPEHGALEHGVRLDLAVFTGSVECVEVADGRTTVATIPAGVTGPFVARAGNRLRNHAPWLGELGPFGVVLAGPNTELEVRSMEFSRSHGVVVASALTLGVVAGVATWQTLKHSETASAGEVLRMEAQADGGQGGPALAAENERLRQRVQQLEAEAQALQLQASRAPAPAPVPAPAAPAAEAAEPAQGEVLFSDERYADVLAGIDWKLMGDVQREMAPLLVELAEAVAKEGGEVPTDLAIKIQELNQKLVGQVPALLKAGLPGFGPNGAYTHPLVVANSLASTLASAGQPLNDAQRAAISGLVRSFGIENQGIVDQSREFDLEHLLAETEMKDRFYREVSTLLTPEQFGSVYPAGSTAYDGISLFNTGLMMRPYTEAVSSRDPAEFARLASNKLGERLGLDEATAAQVRTVVERVASRSPEMWQDRSTGVETTLRMLRTGRTPAALKRQIEAMREILRNVPLSPEQRKKLMSMKHVLVPLPR